MLPDRGEFVRRVADAFVVGDGDAAVAAAVFEPLLVGPVGREQIVMPFHREARGGKDLGKALAEVTVGEKDALQAARSYRTACSISAALKS